MSLQSKPSLLFLDDEPRILSAMRSVFRLDYEVSVATDGHEAVELLRRQHFDVIISDQRMPGMNGVEFLRIASDIAPNAVRILLTGYSDMDAIVGAINDVEIHRFLQKPWDNAAIRRTVAEAVELALALHNAGDHPQTQPMAAHGASAGESLMVVDQETKLFSLVQAEFAGRFGVVHARSVFDCLNLMEATPCNVLLCSLDVDSEPERVFLMRLKEVYPHIIVITLCSTTDSNSLIELINKARIYRFVKKPTQFGVIKRYLDSAIDLAGRQQANPVLLRKQQAEALPPDTAEGVASLPLLSRMQRIRRALFGRPA